MICQRYVIVDLSNLVECFHPRSKIFAEGVTLASDENKTLNDVGLSVVKLDNKQRNIRVTNKQRDRKTDRLRCRETEEDINYETLMDKQSER